MAAAQKWALLALLVLGQPSGPGKFNHHGAHTGEEDGARRAESAAHGDANPNG